jgi:diguanylate cyclase (GGDEF)-like protein/PAS domain S-box-containing protein
VSMEQKRGPSNAGALTIVGVSVLVLGGLLAATVPNNTELGARLGLASAVLALLYAVLLWREGRRFTGSSGELGEAKQSLQLVEARFDALLRHAADVVLILTPSGTCVYISPSSTWVIGVKPEAAIGRPLDALLGSGAPKVLEQLRSISGVPGLVASVEVHLSQPNGATKVVEARLSNLVHDLSVGGVVLHLADVTDRRRYEQLLERQAGSDALTGLFNRSRLDDVLKMQWADHLRRGQKFALLFCDLDGFKSVNDRFGHEAGDEVLREVARRLTQAVRGHDVVVRYGGDEFVIVCPNTDEALSEIVARRMHESICMPILVSNGVAGVGVSIGIAIGPGSFPDVETLMRHADELMYRIKGAKHANRPQPR